MVIARPQLLELVARESAGEKGVVGAADESRLILVAGATGYVGARLVPRLVAAGHRVRAMGRSMEKLRSRPWAGSAGVELVLGDVSDKASLERALAGVNVV